MQPGTAIFDEEEGCFKMWYTAQPSRAKPDAGPFLCYATSADGVHWDKPELDLVEYEGSRANNIVLRGVNWTHCILKEDVECEPERRYKLLYWDRPKSGLQGIYAAFSADGIHWDPLGDNPVVPSWATGDTFSVMRDPSSGRYWLYHKTPAEQIRTVSRIASDDFVHWKHSRKVLAPDAYDPPDTQFYGLSAFPYAEQYLGLLWVYHTYAQTMDLQLASSRDGSQWDRTADRKLLIHLIPTNNYQGGAFDSMMIYPASSPILKDARLWLYYSGFTVPHNTSALDHDGSIGLATLREDGFCSLDVTSPGYILTRPSIWNGDRLRINAATIGPEARDMVGISPSRELTDSDNFGRGGIRVGLEDEQGRPIGDYSVENCTPFQGDETDITVAWRGRDDLSELKGKTVQLRFELSNARIYSWTVHRL